MGLEPVPDDDEGCCELTIQLGQKRHRARGIDIGIRVQAKVQVYRVPARRHAQRTDDAEFLMRMGPLVQDWRLPTRRPGPAHQRRHQQSRFVDEDQPGLQARGVFFTRGQSVLTQFAIACSSRSTARRIGFCGLHPMACIKRPIWST